MRSEPFPFLPVFTYDERVPVPENAVILFRFLNGKWGLSAHLDGEFFDEDGDIWSLEGHNVMRAGTPYQIVSLPVSAFTEQECKSGG